MKFIKTKFKYLIIASVFFIALQKKSYAGGFPVRPGSLLLSPSVNYFFANSGWDSLRRKSPFSKSGSYSSITYSLYSEYGISRRFTLVVLLPYVINNYKQSDYSSLTNGLTDLETGIKYYVANINYKYYFSLQATVIAPLYNQPNLGYREMGAELKASFAGSGHLLGKNFYFNIDNGIRQYFGNSGPVQDRYTGTFGLTLDKKFKHQIAVSAGGFYSTSNFSAFAQNLAINKNFSFNQASLSYGYTFSKRFSVFLTAGTFINGRNTGDGSSASASFIIRPL